MLRRVIVSVGVLTMLGAIPAVSASASQPTQQLKVTSFAKQVCSVSTSPKVAYCMAWVKTDKAGNTLVTPNVVQGMTPKQYHKAYNLPTTVTGRHVIAIVDAYSNPNIYTDLQRYQAMFHISTYHKCGSRAQTNCLIVMNQKGMSTPLPKKNAGWALEIALDVEIARAICQNCRIELYEANSANFSDLEVAVNTAAARGDEVISNSYGSAPGSQCADVPAYDHPGVAITVSAGDYGYGTACPASLNTVVSVGGTTLTDNGDGTYSESVWSGTGSGCATLETPQTFQTTADNWATIACPGRGMNDVSADADPSTGAAIYDGYAGRGWVVVGGTSLSAPLIGGVYALASNASNWSYPAQSVYDSPTSLNDVTTGNNGTCGGHVLACDAGAGYDLPTGIGTPNGLGGF
jgi:subtilase family serine protease